MRKSLEVDGEDPTGDGSITAFTAAELEAWIRGTSCDAANERPTTLNGKLPVLTMQEIIAVAKARSTATGRTTAVYPEAKNPDWNRASAIGVDGIHTEFANTGFPARAADRKETGR